MIIKGVLDYSKYYCEGKNHVITSNAEHKATLNVCKYLNGEIYSNNDATMSLFAANNKVDRAIMLHLLKSINMGLYQQKSLKLQLLTEQPLLHSFMSITKPVLLIT